MHKIRIISEHSMSKIGKKSIIIPEDITININDGVLEFKKGNSVSNFKILPYVKAEISEATGNDGKTTKNLNFKIDSNLKQAQANWGTTRALVQNIIKGLKEGFSKVLIIEGIGFRAALEGEKIVLNVGFSHPVKYTPQKGIKISVDKNLIIVSGESKDLVGQTAAQIRAIKKPEPYKGKGIRYKDEYIRRKAGKKAGAATK